MTPLTNYAETFLEAELSRVTNPKPTTHPCGRTEMPCRSHFCEVHGWTNRRLDLGREEAERRGSVVAK